MTAVGTTNRSCSPGLWRVWLKLLCRKHSHRRHHSNTGNVAKDEVRESERPAHAQPNLQCFSRQVSLNTRFLHTEVASCVARRGVAWLLARSAGGVTSLAASAAACRWLPVCCAAATGVCAHPGQLRHQLPAQVQVVCRGLAGGSVPAGLAHVPAVQRQRARVQQVHQPLRSLCTHLLTPRAPRGECGPRRQQQGPACLGVGPGVC